MSASTQSVTAPPAPFELPWLLVGPVVDPYTGATLKAWFDVHFAVVNGHAVRIEDLSDHSERRNPPFTAFGPQGSGIEVGFGTLEEAKACAEHAARAEDPSDVCEEWRALPTAIGERHARVYRGHYVEVWSSGGEADDWIVDVDGAVGYEVEPAYKVLKAAAFAEALANLDRGEVLEQPWGVHPELSDWWQRAVINGHEVTLCTDDGPSDVAFSACLPWRSCPSATEQDFAREDEAQTWLDAEARKDAPGARDGSWVAEGGGKGSEFEGIISAERGHYLRIHGSNEHDGLWEVQVDGRIVALIASAPGDDPMRHAKQHAISVARDMASA